MIACSYDCDYFVDLYFRAKSPGTEICIECKKLISPSTEHYRAREWSEDENGDEVALGNLPVCEECGDLAASFMELGYCWDYTALRDDIREMNEAYGL